MKHYFATLLGLAVTAGAAVAQNPPITGTTIIKNAYQNRSLHATTSIELQPGFSVTTAGFEARIVPPATTHGSWTSPLAWAVPSANGPSPIVGIHTHVLPDGRVLSWEGHNDNGHWNNQETHALTWNPTNNLFEHFDNEDSNIFCSGHSFLADGRLLVAGGHYADYILGNGVGLPQDLATLYPPNSFPPGIIGLADANIFDFVKAIPALPGPWTSVTPMAY